MDENIDCICERLFLMAEVAIKPYKEGDRVPMAALEAAIVNLIPAARAAVVAQLDSPERLQRIGDWMQLVLPDPALGKRLVMDRPQFARAMLREVATEIVWRLAANKGLPPFLA